MKRFIEGEDRTQVTLLPECLDDFIAEDNSVRVVDAFVDAQRTQTRPSYLSIDKDVFAPEVAHTNWDQGRLQVDHALAIIDSLRHRLVGSDINGEVSHYRYETWWKRRLSAMDDQPDIDPAMLAEWQAQQHALNLKLLAAIAARDG